MKSAGLSAVILDGGSTNACPECGTVWLRLLEGKPFVKRCPACGKRVLWGGVMQDDAGTIAIDIREQADHVQ